MLHKYVTEQKSGFRTLDEHELESVSGGFDDPGAQFGSGPNGSDGFGDGLGDLWEKWRQITGEECPIIATGCNGDITVHSTWRSLDVGGGREIRTFEDGTQALYVNGEYQAEIELTHGEIVDGEPTVGFEISESGLGGSYTSGDSIKYYFDFKN